MKNTIIAMLTCLVFQMSFASRPPLPPCLRLAPTSGCAAPYQYQQQATSSTLPALYSCQQSCATHIPAPSLPAMRIETEMAALDIDQHRSPSPQTPQLADFFDDWGKTSHSGTYIQGNVAFRHLKEFKRFHAGQDYSLDWIPEDMDHEKIKEALNEFKGIDEPQRIIDVIFNIDLSQAPREVSILTGALYELFIALHLKKEKSHQDIRFSMEHPNPLDAKKLPVEIDIETDKALIECKCSIKYSQLQHTKEQLQLRKLVADQKNKEMKLVVLSPPRQDFIDWLQKQGISFEIVPIVMRKPLPDVVARTNIIQAEFDKFVNNEEFSLHWIPGDSVDKILLKKSLEFARNIRGSKGKKFNPIDNIFTLDKGYEEFDRAAYELTVALTLDKLNYPILQFAKGSRTPDSQTIRFGIETDKYLITCKHHRWGTAPGCLKKKLLVSQAQAKLDNKTFIFCCAHNPPSAIEGWLQEKGIPLVVTNSANDRIDLDQAVQEIKNKKQHKAI